MTTVYDLSSEQLVERLGAWGEPAFRARQVWAQLWRRAATYERMSDVAPALRERLAEELPLGVEVLDERAADRGATRKVLLRLGGSHAVETVLMGYPDRVTACVSSQVGCAMGCTFCATGQMGLQHNLSAGEIAAQAVWARREAARLPDTTPQRLTNVVFMGMGEPIGGCLLPRSTNTSSAPLTMTSVTCAKDPSPRLGLQVLRRKGSGTLAEIADHSLRGRLDAGFARERQVRQVHGASHHYSATEAQQGARYSWLCCGSPWISHWRTSSSFPSMRMPCRC